MKAALALFRIFTPSGNYCDAAPSSGDPEKNIALAGDEWKPMRS
jgi:hypothetical protein